MVQKNLWSINIKVPKKLDPKRLVKIGSVTANIVDMDHSRQDLYCLDKCRHHNSLNLIKIVSGTYIQNLVKIKLVTTEIFLICTNVARTNVVWTNVSVTVGNCSRCSQEPTFKVWSKLGQ